VSTLIDKSTRINNSAAALVADVATAFEEVKESNALRMSAGLQQFVVLLLAAFAAWSVDFATDYTCDAWSQSCRDLSVRMRVNVLLAHDMCFVNSLICFVVSILQQCTHVTRGRSCAATCRCVMQVIVRVECE
jgi:hypothetical protein